MLAKTFAAAAFLGLASGKPFYDPYDLKDTT